MTTKTILTHAVLLTALLTGIDAGRDSSEPSASTTTPQAVTPLPVPEPYRQIRQEDGFRYIARTQGEINRGGVVEEIGFHLYLIDNNGKEHEIPLLNTTVSNSQVETKDFGTLKMKANINSLARFLLLKNKSRRCKSFNRPRNNESWSHIKQRTRSMKVILFTFIFSLFFICGCGRNSPSEGNSPTATGAAVVYRQVKDEDGIHFYMRSDSGGSRGGKFHAEGLQFG